MDDVIPGIECWLRSKKDENGKDTDVVFGRLYISLDKSSSTSLLISVINFSIFSGVTFPFREKDPI